MAAGVMALQKSPDTLRRLLVDLCTRSPPPREGSALNLAKHVEEEARDLTGEAFTRFMDSLYERISALVESSDAVENLGAVRAIDELISVQLGESATKIAKFASFLQKIFESKQDPDTIVAASVALGHLASTGGALTADVVESQVKIALAWLQGERVESHRFAAVLILKVSKTLHSNFFLFHHAFSYAFAFV
jgi:FKBP12-rapamycin complex-associated protein